MSTVNKTGSDILNSFSSRHLQKGRGRLLRIMTLALCTTLTLPGIALAKKPVQDATGCVMFPPTVYTGFPFTVKVVRDPAYPGSWVAPTVDIKAVFTKEDGSTMTQTHSETIQRYGVTYINATLLAPLCNGDPCDIDIEAGVDITAVVQEPIYKGKRTRETRCHLLDAPVTLSN